MNCIEIKDVSKSFGPVEVLKGIDCQVSLGSVHGFLGPNGAGKTTTIKAILGLHNVDKGQIRLFGERVDTGNVKHLLQRVGYLAQDPVFPEHFTGIEVLEFVAHLYDVPAKDRVPRVKELLDRFELKRAGSRLVKHYSKGMKQRLGLASVWLPKPELLILDEPVSALDPEGRYDVLEQIAEVRGETAVFFSSHILSDVERVADKVTIIGRGRVLLDEKMDNIRGSYISSGYTMRVPYAQVIEAQKLIEALPFINKVEVNVDMIGFQVDERTPLEVSKAVLGPMMAHGIGVLRFNVQEPTLEDIFLTLVNGGGPKS